MKIVRDNRCRSFTYAHSKIVSLALHSKIVSLALHSKNFKALRADLQGLCPIFNKVIFKPKSIRTAPQVRLEQPKAIRTAPLVRLEQPQANFKRSDLQ